MKWPRKLQALNKPKEKISVLKTLLIWFLENVVDKLNKIKILMEEFGQVCDLI